MQALETRIRAQRKKIDNEYHSRGELRAKIDSMRAEADEVCTARHGIRRAAVLRSTCRAMEKDLNKIESGEAKRQFEKRVIPFLEAQGQLVASAPSEGPSERPLPGGRKRRRLGDVASWTHHASVDGSVVREFMAEFEDTPTGTIDALEETCRYCSGRLLVNERKATLCCEECGASFPHIDLSAGTHGSHGEIEFVAQTYKRSNHFLEWLNQLQAKESTEVDDTILEQVMEVMYDKGVRKPDDVTPQTVRTALKALKMRSHYEHVCQICCRITGRAPPRLHGSIEERLRLMFIAAQEPFEIVKGRRKNFLSYSYTLQQFMRLIGVSSRDMGRLAFTLLKGRDKLDRQNQIYEKMCQHLDWEYTTITHN
jgi:hypothetical protein